MNGTDVNEVAWRWGNRAKFEVGDKVIVKVKGEITKKYKDDPMYVVEIENRSSEINLYSDEMELRKES